MIPPLRELRIFRLLGRHAERVINEVDIFSQLHFIVLWTSRGKHPSSRLEDLADGICALHIARSRHDKIKRTELFQFVDDLVVLVVEYFGRTETTHIFEFARGCSRDDFMANLCIVEKRVRDHQQ